MTIPKTGRIGSDWHAHHQDLLISGESGFTTLPSGQRGATLVRVRQGDGRGSGTVFMPAPQTGTPMTYMLGGKQYLVVSVSGAGYPAEILAPTKLTL